MAADLSVYNRRLVSDLLREAKEHGLVLIVGSGVNGDAAPQWKGLLQKLLGQVMRRVSLEDRRTAEFAETLVERVQMDFNVLAQATLAKQILGTEQYRLQIQEAIYGQMPDTNALLSYCKKPNEAERKKFELLRIVANLCQLQTVRAVATFNFDTFLESAIDACGEVSGKIAKPYFGRALSAGGRLGRRGSIPVYHVHGLLSNPRRPVREPTGKIVMSYEEYFERNADPFCMETSSLLHLLRHYCVLWIGVSLDDWNMLRLLDTAKQDQQGLHSYCIQRADGLNKKSHRTTAENKIPDGSLESYRAILGRFRAELFNCLGVRRIVAGNEYEHVAEVLEQKVLNPLREFEQRL